MEINILNVNDCSKFLILKKNKKKLHYQQDLALQLPAQSGFATWHYRLQLTHWASNNMKSIWECSRLFSTRLDMLVNGPLFWVVCFTLPKQALWCTCSQHPELKIWIIYRSHTGAGPTCIVKLFIFLIRNTKWSHTRFLEVTLCGGRKIKA